MDIWADCEEGVDGPGPRPVERALIGLVRAASLPLFMVAIVMAGAIYGAAGLARSAGFLSRKARHLCRSGRGWPAAASPQDA